MNVFTSTSRVRPLKIMLKPKSQTLVWDLINMHNVLNHVSDRSQWQTQKKYKVSTFGLWPLLYRPKLRRHSWRICFVYNFTSAKVEVIWFDTSVQGGYIFYAGASLAGAGYCRQCRRRPAILPLQLWQGCQDCVKISAQRLPRVAQFKPAEFTLGY